MRSKITFLIAFLMLPMMDFMGGELFAQVQINTPASFQPASLEQGGAAGLFRADITNNTGAPLTGSTFTVVLPAGMEYVAGTSTGAIEANISNLQQPSFTLNTVPVGNTLTVTFSARINCGFSTNSITYNVLQASTVLATSTSTVAGNTPSPAFAFTTAPSPSSIITQLNTDQSRTFKLKNSGSVALSQIIIEDKVQTAAQAPAYLVKAVSAGTLSSVTNGYRIVLTGTALQNAITAAGGATNGDVIFDANEELSLTLTEQMLSCATGNSIQLNFTAGSTDVKNNFCFNTTSTASISSVGGNPSLALTSNFINPVAVERFPTYCTDGRVTETMKNNGSVSGGKASAIYDIKLPWSTLVGGPQILIPPYPNYLMIKKVFVNGVDVTAAVLTRNFQGDGSSLIYGAQNVDVINFAGLTATTAAGTGFTDENGDGHYDDLMPGASASVDITYGFNFAAMPSCRLDSGSGGYFSIGSSFKDQCGTVINKFDYPYNGSGTPSFLISGQYADSKTASLSKTVFNAAGDASVLNVSLLTSLNGMYNSGFAGTGASQYSTKEITITLPDGLGYDTTKNIIINGVVLPSSNLNYTVTGTGPVSRVLILKLNSVVPVTQSAFVFDIPVVAIAEPVINKNVVTSGLLYFDSCPSTKKDFVCATLPLNYEIVTGICPTIATTGFKATRASFGYIHPANAATSAFFTPTGYVNESTPGISLTTAMSKDKVKMNFKGIVNGGAYDELWARTTYTAIPNATGANFGAAYTDGTAVAGTITIRKGADGTTSSTNLKVSDVVFSTNAGLQVIQANIGQYIGAGKPLAAPVAGDSIFVNYAVRVLKDSPSYQMAPITDLIGELYTKTAGIESNCQRLPAPFKLVRMYNVASGFVGIGTIAGATPVKFRAGFSSPINTGNISNLFTNEARLPRNFRTITATIPGIWELDTANAPSAESYGQPGTPRSLNPAAFVITYSGGNTIINFTNDTFDADGMPKASSNLPFGYDAARIGGGILWLNWFMKAICVPSGDVTATIQQNTDLYTATKDENGVLETDLVESNNQTYTSGGGGYKYAAYSANSSPTLSAVDGVSDTVSWQVRVTNTTNPSDFGGTPTDIPNNWMSFDAPNNNITVTKVVDVATGIEYPTVSYGTGKYWAKLGTIAGTEKYFNIIATYTACTPDSVNYTYGFSTSGYPIDPETGYATGTCASNTSTAVLNLFPKDVNLTMSVVSPANPVQFCSSTDPLENPINYTITVTNTDTANALNLLLEATFPEGYTAKAGTSTLTYDGVTKTLSDPVYNSTLGVWQWAIATDPNGIPFLPGVASGKNTMVLAYQGATQCGFISGSSVKYHMASSSGCGKVADYTATGNSMVLSMIPANLNSYYLTPSVITINNDGSGADYLVEIKNQGSSPISPDEVISITLPAAINYVTGSVTHIAGAANVGEPLSNTVIGTNRILTFPLPVGVDGTNLVQNETASFNIKFKIVNAAALSCGTLTEAIDLKSIFSIPNAICNGTPCPVRVITGSAKSDVNIIKTSLAVNITDAVGVLASATSNNITVKYTVGNTGSIGNTTPIVVDFFNDLNSDGKHNIGEPILFTQTLNNGTETIASGGVSIEQTTSAFAVDEDDICKITAAIRVINNSEICTESNAAVPIKFTPAIVDFEICPTTNLTIGNIPNGATVTWSPATYLSASNISNPVFNYNGPAVTVPTQLTYTASIVHPGGCTSTYIDTVTVNPAPTIVITNPTAVCSGTAVDLTASAITAGSTSGLTFEYFTDAAGTVTLATPAAVTTAGTYYIKGNTASTCSDIQPVTVTVNPLPTAAIAGTNSVCQGTATPVVSFTGANGTAPYTFTYTINNGSNLTVSTVGSNDLVNVPVSTTTAGSFVYTLVSVKDSSSSVCEQLQSSSATVTVNPAPSIVITSPAAVCSGTSVDLTAAAVTVGSTAGLTFAYYTDAAGTAVLTAPDAVTAGGTYYIKGTTAAGCSAIQPVTVTVNPLPVVVTVNPAAVCSGTSVDLTAATITAGSTAGLTFEYYTDASGTAVLASPDAVTAGGTYYIKGTTAAGCSDIQLVTVTVNPLPTVVTVNPVAVCSGASVDLTAAAITAGSSAGLTFAYYTDAAGTAVLASPAAVTAGGTYYIKGTTAAGCSDIQPVTVTVNPLPIVVTVNPAAVCSGTSVDLTAAAVTAGSTAGLTFAYYTDAAGTLALASPAAVTAGGTYYIKGTTAAGCSDIQPVTVTVNPLPVVVTVNPSAVCSGTSVDLTAAAVTAGSTAGLTFAYYTDAAGTAVLASPAAVTAGGTYYIKGTTAAGCSDIQPVTVTVNPLPSVVTVNPAAVCSGTSVDLTAAAVTAGSTAGLTFEYYTDAAGTAVLASPAAVTAGGTYYIKGTTAAGCSDIQPVTVTVNPLPVVVTVNPAAVCSGTSVDLTAAGVTAGSTAGLTFAYYTDATGTLALASPAAVTAGGTYYIKGTTAAGCSDIQPVTVTVNPLPAVVTVNPAAVCSGTSVDLTAAAVTAGSTAGLTFEYYTDAAGTAVLASPAAVTAGGTYYIKGTTAAGCSDIQPVTVTVNPLPVVVTVNPAAVCSGTSVDLTVAAVTAGSTAGLTFEYYRDATGTAVLASPDAVTAGGTYYIKGTTAAGCSHIQPVTVTVNPLPAVVTVNPAAVCSGTSVDLTAAAVTAGSTAGLTFEYYTDAAGTLALATPQAVTAGGTYYIKGATAAGCSDIQPVTVTVNPLPSVVTVNPVAVCSGTSVDLTATAVTAGSTAGLTFEYYTDAAGTAVLASPAAVTAGGTYYIKGTTAAGCSDIQPVTVTVNPLPAVVTVNPAAVCSGTSVDLTAAAVTAGSTPGLTFAYYTDAAGTAVLASPDAVTADGTYYIKGTTSAGCSDIQPVTVTVNPTPSVVTVNPAAVCSGTSVDLTATAVTAGSTAGLTFEYYTDAAGTAVLASPDAVTAGGTYYIKGTTAAGCSDIQPVTVTVNPLPAVVTVNPAAVCSGTSIDLTAAAVTAGSTAGLTFEYYTDAAGTLALATPQAVIAGGAYYIKGTTAAGCSSTLTEVTVTVNALLTQTGTESTACAADGTGYVLKLSVTGQAPYTASGTGAPGTWIGNNWTSDKILAGTDYNVSVNDSYACNTIVISNVAPVCCVYAVTTPTFPATTITCYDQMPIATSLTEAEYEALGNGDGQIGDTPCGTIEIIASNSPDPGCDGNVIRTYTVTEYADPNNNQVRDNGEDTILNTTASTQTFTLQRADFVMPANQASTVNCISEVVTPAVPEVSDNCGNLLTASGPIISAIPTCNGVLTYTYTFTDCAGHAHDWVYSYTINNTIAPKGTVPADLTVQCINDIPVANINAVTNITGNCNNTVTVTVVDTNNGGSGCSSSPYIVIRTFTLTDCGGLTTTLVQTITAKDTTAPVFVGTLPLNVIMECSAAIPAAPTLTATDNCSAATVSYSEVKQNGSCSGNYQLVRTWKAIDICGNEAVHTQTISVQDTTAPTFVEALPTAVIEANCNTIPEAVTLTATDSCGAATVDFTETKVDEGCSGKYQLLRNWRAVDECGNENVFTQTINVGCIAEIYNGLSPNGDGINDKFIIGSIDCFPNNSVKIYNRYGVIVYEKDGYDNVTNPFEGISEGRGTVRKGDKLPTGTYFYILEYENNGSKVQKSGYLYISNQ